MVAGNPDVVARLLHRNLLCSARGRPAAPGRSNGPPRIVYLLDAKKYTSEGSQEIF